MVFRPLFATNFRTLRRATSARRARYAHARARAFECSFVRFARTAVMIVPETQLDARERSDDEMPIVEVLATQFPGVPVTQLDSNGFDARGQCLDPISIVRDSASVRFASQRAGLTAVATSAVTVALRLARDLEG